MLGMAVFYAIRDAVAAAADYRVVPSLNAPATAEAIQFAVEAAKAGARLPAAKKAAA
jgi:xanthine dehydrogenase large subunit